MAEPITVRLNDELHAKILSEAEQKKCSASQIIREKIEQAFIQEENKEQKQRLGRIEAKLIEIAPHARRAENISCWALLFLAESTKLKLSSDTFRDVRKAVDERYSEYLKTNELKF